MSSFHLTEARFKCLMSGSMFISVTDATYASGAIALDVSSQVISFTNVMVTAATPNSVR